MLNRTREPVAAGTFEFSDFRELGVVFDNAAVRVAELNQGRKKDYCGRRFAAGQGVSDAAMLADISRQLGAGWQAPETVPNPASAITIYRWQSQCSARFYALLAYPSMQTSVTGEAFRPMESMYACGSA